MIELIDSTGVNIFAPVCSGKTYLTKQLMANKSRVAIMDTMGDYADDPSYEHIWRNPKQFAQRIKENDCAFRLAYHPSGSIQGSFEWLTKSLWVIDTSKWFVCEEVHEVCGIHSSDDSIRDILRYSRHRLLGFLGISQRIPEVNKALCSAARMNILFYTEEANDLDAIADRWGSKVANAVSELRPLIYDDVTQVTSQVPECLVLQRGKNPLKYDLAKLGEGKSICDSAEKQQMYNQRQSLVPDSGLQEPK